MWLKTTLIFGVIVLLSFTYGTSFPDPIHNPTCYPEFKEELKDLKQEMAIMKR